jgi:hypothetical protein
MLRACSEAVGMYTTRLIRLDRWLLMQLHMAEFDRKLFRIACREPCREPGHRTKNEIHFNVK